MSRFCLGLWPQRALPAAVYRDSVAEDTSTSTKTFTGRTIGPASPGRRVYVGGVSSTVNAHTITSVTIGGVTANIDVQVSSGTFTAYIASALVPDSVIAGTTADIVITTSAATARFAIGIWSSNGVDNAAAVGTATSTSAPSTLNLPVADDGFVIAIAQSGNDPNFSWSGATGRFDLSSGGTADVGGADASGLSASGSYALSVSYSASGTTTAVAASYR